MEFVDIQDRVAQTVVTVVMIPLVFTALIVCVVTFPIWVFPWAFDHYKWMQTRIPNPNYRKD